MKTKYTTCCFTLMLFLTLSISCANTSISASRDESAADAEKTLVPHSSWTCEMPDGIPKPENGVLVFDAQINLDQVYDVGKTQYGRRQVLVVKDGTITGEKIKASVMPLGLDFQLTLSSGVIEIEQVLVFRTNDSKYIYVRNAGTGISEKDVRIVMDFEAPNNSSSAWLNTGKYVARRTVDLTAKTLKMSVYDVSEAAAKIEAANAVKISKPADVPLQSWDYRKASPSEQRGEQIITENVTLGASTSVGASKRGMRNIIPITGGTLTGMITGKVLPGGADYQNLSNPATIDARYLWQTDEGEVIIVRNAGPFGSLVPTFEAKVDGKYAWLNSGIYLSSNPGMGAGGVSLTMYKSK
ncbi:MAG: DUF3237 family protein [Sedimentisphaerales bacterium]|nr:DUF3237 family protein [Sedimentisphaerales bacterium]